MRFLILRPPVTTEKTAARSGMKVGDPYSYDPRHTKLASMDELHLLIPPIARAGAYYTEKEAAAEVRHLYPDAVGMPFPLVVGSGTTYLLGFVADPSKPIDPDVSIPFVLFVQPVAEDDYERKKLKTTPPFDRALWKVPPKRPTFGKVYPVELRATDLEVPAFTHAQVGQDERGRLTIFVEVGGVAMSLAFQQERLLLVSDDELDTERSERP